MNFVIFLVYHDETDDPITVLTSFMKNFAKFEEIYPRYSKFFIAGKIQFFYRFLKHTESEDQFKLKSKEQQYVAQINSCYLLIIYYF